MLLKRLFGKSGERKPDPAPASAPAASARSFLPIYEEKYAHLVEHRASGFRTMFQLLEARCKTLGRPALIVETGSMRKPGNWAGDGQSTFLWKEFSTVFPSEVHTVDLDPEAAEVVRQACGPAVQAHTGDSIAYLDGLARQKPPRQIDLLYLDSYDFDPSDPFPSAMHHIKELIAISPCIGRGTIIAIDDNFTHPDPDDDRVIGKGYLALEWFRHLNIPEAHRGYQFVWQL